MQVNGFDIQGHRGCRGLRPENTIQAMIHALELGVTTLEMDVVISADEKVVVSHEPYFNHLFSTHPHGRKVEKEEEAGLNIFKMPYEDVCKYDVGSRQHPLFPEQLSQPAHKPQLSELINATEEIRNNNNPVFYNIETKCTDFTDNLFHPAPERFVDLLVEVIKSASIEDRVIIQSFDFRTLRYLHSIAPHIQTAILIESYKGGTVEDHIAELGFEPSVYSSHYSIINTQLMKTCHRKKMRVIPWTVNEVSTMKQLIELGVDGIITDYPDRLIALLRQK